MDKRLATLIGHYYWNESYTKKKLMEMYNLSLYKINHGLVMCLDYNLVERYDNAHEKDKMMDVMEGE